MISSLQLKTKLPISLQERIRSLRDGDMRSSFVLYWMCTAVRTEENPALDTAIELANRQGIPLLVYQGLSYRYPFASDRHHRFILEGARDVQAQCKRRNIPYVFHLEHHNSPPVLRILSSMASIVITEDIPIPHMRSWINRLWKSTDVPFWKIDTACIIPLSLGKKVYTRAFSFRDEFASKRLERLEQEWLNIELEHRSPLPTLPFDSIDLQHADLSVLIAQCPIDHSVPYVHDTIGGTAEGTRRWKRFLQKDIDHYHYKRNRPNQLGVSRMSAYLHYGQVSPFRLARDAHRRGGKGAEKFLDELLIWRELSYHWCNKTPNPAHWNALPEWARKTLSKEKNTPREQQYSWEALYRGKTHDALWNLAQQSLLRHGELHNNVRMTWGKMLHNWTNNPQQSLRWLIDLNNRLALDGKDPSSYGGLLWCLGLFDRPSSSSKPIFGSVRTRASKEHALRLDLNQYQTHVTRNSPADTIAIIGAGISGLICARNLQDHGHSVVLFDKARGVGGRTSTRISRNDEEWIFDHGLPYLQYKDPRFQLWIRAWENSGVIQHWNAKIQQQTTHDYIPIQKEMFVGIPKNSSLAEHIANDLEIHAQQRILHLRYTPRGWFAHTEKTEHGPYKKIILTLPPEQLRELLPTNLHFPEIQTQSHPQHALLLRFDEDFPSSFDAAKLNHPIISWICREASKPQRPQKNQWTILTQPTWSTEHVDREPKDLVPALIKAFQEIMQMEKEPTTHQIHRWRYSQAKDPHHIGSWWSPEFHIGVCGDWLHGGGIEGAYLSGIDLFGKIMRHEE